jgi:hypothetical protein
VPPARQGPLGASSRGHPPPGSVRIPFAPLRDDGGDLLAAPRGSGWRRAAAGALVAACLLPAAPGRAAVLVTQAEALREAFPGGAPKREVRFLDDSQAARVGKSAGAALDSRVVIRYVGTREGGPGWAAYFDRHEVRTLPETIMVLVGPDGRVARIDILSFEEPREYLPRARWLDQFTGRELSDDLAIERGIRAITGATLSSRAVNAAVRRVLAIDRELRAEALAGPAAGHGDGR